MKNEPIFIVIRAEANILRLHASPNPAAHIDFLKAKTEAERLARQNPGERFIVFQSAGHAEKDPPPTLWTAHDEIPF